MFFLRFYPNEVGLEVFEIVATKEHSFENSNFDETLKKLEKSTFLIFANMKFLF
jgi:hypothetical protein